MKEVVVSRLAGIDKNPFLFDQPYICQPLNVFELVTPDGVLKLLGSIPSKSSPMDFLPTSVLNRCIGVIAPLISRLANLSFQDPAGKKITPVMARNEYFVKRSITINS